MSIVKVTDNEMVPVREAIGELREYFSSKSLKEGREVSFSIRTYGCQLNESDSEKIYGTFEAMGIKEHKGEGAPDIVLLNTCAVRENAEDRLFGNLGVYKADKKDNRDMLIIVCGCMMKVKENVDRIKKSFPYVDLVFDPQQIHLFPVLLRDCLRRKKQLVNISAEDYIADDSMIPVTRLRKFRALVPIMYGCNNFCSFCIVPYTRGRERSRDFSSVVEEVRSLGEKGYKEVMLLGQNVNSYRSEDNRSFPDLLRPCAEVEGINRIRFMSSHPKDISDEVIDIMAEYKNIETHLHLPVQCGSDALLKKMNRPYTVEKYMSVVERFRKLIPEGSLSTDIIVGFPGETEEDFQGTLDVVRRAQYDFAFTFQYSIRPGTRAASMPDQIPAEVVSERFQRLLDLQNDLTYKSNLAKVGKTEEVLIEGRSMGSDEIFTGRTMSNHLINFTIPDNIRVEGDLEGRLAMVNFTGARPYSVDGVLEAFS